MKKAAEVVKELGLDESLNIVELFLFIFCLHFHKRMFSFDICFNQQKQIMQKEKLRIFHYLQLFG